MGWSEVGLGQGWAREGAEGWAESRQGAEGRSEGGLGRLVRELTLVWVWMVLGVGVSSSSVVSMGLVGNQANKQKRVGSNLKTTSNKQVPGLPSVEVGVLEACFPKTKC